LYLSHLFASVGSFGLSSGHKGEGSSTDAMALGGYLQSVRCYCCFESYWLGYRLHCLGMEEAIEAGGKDYWVDCRGVAGSGVEAVEQVGTLLILGVFLADYCRYLLGIPCKGSSWEA